MPLARGCGCVSGIVVGSLAALVLCLGLGLAWWWGAAAWAAAFVLGAVIGRSIKRDMVERIEFTRSQIHLTSSTSARTVEIGSVIEINVLHSGDAVADRRTTLQVRFASSNRLVKTVGVTNRRDATLASALARLLGPEIRIRETTTNPVRDT
ncbi:hypothetical protein [Saccharopolyspora sp. 5N708]|uniref:hypothetical protein n=1 Tax=Saccharopolyspora sp. 5N708 TaxID=3457424 RepID=UPI003FD2BCF2